MKLKTNLKSLFFTLTFGVCMLLTHAIHAQVFQPYTVKKDDTVESIAKKFGVQGADIVKYNPHIQNKDLTAKQVIIISVVADGQVAASGSAATVSATDNTPAVISDQNRTEGEFIIHTIRAKETAWSLSRTYGVSLTTLSELNEHLIEDFRIGREIRIPLKKEASTTHTETAVTTDENAAHSIQYHVVQLKETAFSIARAFGTTFTALVNLNPGVDMARLRAGERIIISNKDVNTAAQKQQQDFVSHTVEAKETKYGISKRYNITTETLDIYNPEYKDKSLPIGAVLRIPAGQQVIAAEKQRNENEQKIAGALHDATIEEENTPAHPAENIPIDLGTEQVINVAVMLPFYLDINQSAVFERMAAGQKPGIYDRSEYALGFYSGVKMALDSLEKMGIRAHVKVFDTNRDNATVDKIVASNDFSKTNLIIGPLYSEIVDHLSDKLQHKVLIVSPLSMKHDQSDAGNIVQVTTPKNLIRTEALNSLAHIADNKTNYILVGSPTADREYIARAKEIIRNATAMPVMQLNNQGELSNADIFSMVDSTRRNVFVLLNDTKQSVFALASFYSIHLNSSAQVEVFCIDADVEGYLAEINNSNLEKLRFTYPTRNFLDKQKKSTLRFCQAYENQYGAQPNKWAIAGFDLTYDLLLRFVKYPTVEDALMQIDTQGNASKYDYLRQKSGGYFNRGFFMMRYTPYEGLCEIKE